MLLKIIYFILPRKSRIGTFCSYSGQATPEQMSESYGVVLETYISILLLALFWSVDYTEYLCKKALSTTRTFLSMMRNTVHPYWKLRSPNDADIATSFEGPLLQAWITFYSSMYK